MLFQNIDLEDREERAEKLLKMVGLGDRMDHQPNQLSGGQQQRVAIARSLANNPEVILADEPTGNLDPELSMDILRLFEEFNNHGTTVLIATHDLGLISRMKYRSLTLKDGRMSQDPLAEATL